MNTLYISYDGLLDFVAQSQVLPHLEGLSGKGHNITLLTFEKIRSRGDKALLEKYRDRLTRSNIDFIWLKYHKRPVVPATVFDIAHAFFAGMGIFRRKKIEIIHARGYVAAIMATLMRYFFRAKVIFDMRGFWPDEKVDAGFWRKQDVLYKLFKRIEGYLLSRSDAVVVLTESAKVFLSKRHSLKRDVYIIPCCTDLKAFRPFQENIPPANNVIADKCTILYAGSLGSFYDLDKILDFFVFLKKREKTARLRIITNYPEDAIRRKARMRDINESDYLVERLGLSEMPEAFSEACLSLIFYKRQTSGIGCCPIKFAESMAGGVPVAISSGIGDCDDIVRDNKVGVILKDFSEEEYEQAFKTIREFFNDRGQLRFRCRAVAEKFFSLSSGIEKYHNVYTKVMSS